MERVIVTGGAGFIGSNLVDRLIDGGHAHVLTLDKLTYAGNLASLETALASPRHRFLKADIADAAAMADAIASFEPTLVLHLAAESHVDRSIDGPSAFIATNVGGTAVLLEETHRYWRRLDAARQQAFRFVHVSTDEVFGSLGPDGAFSEASPHAPNSPYSATKAGADHLVRAWAQTYGLPTINTHCSNNYGPRQYPEKMIPLMIVCALEGRPLPVYGDGKNIRDWIHVGDHVEAILAAAGRGTPGARYVFGGGAELTNIDLVRTLCRILDRMRPSPRAGGYESLISFVPDRPGHDFRYAMDDRATRAALGWRPRYDFPTGLEATVRWYLAREDWWRPLLARAAKARAGRLDRATP